MNESPGWLWIPQGLLWRVQDLPRSVFLVLGGLGALAGYIYAVSNGTSVKVTVFWGFVLGFASPGLVVLAIGLAGTVGIVGGFLAIVYNVFLVPDGENWRLPEIVHSIFTARMGPRAGPARVSSAPLTEQHVHAGIRDALRDSVDLIIHRPSRTAAQLQLDAFATQGFRILTCTYEGSASYDFWYLQSPVRRHDFPRLPPVEIAVLHDAAIEVCPPTRSDAEQLWHHVLAAR